MHKQPDSSMMALVYVVNEHEARYTITHLHRKKIGYKRIHVSLHKDASTDPHRLRQVSLPND